VAAGRVTEPGGPWGVTGALRQQSKRNFP